MISPHKSSAFSLFETRESEYAENRFHVFLNKRNNFFVLHTLSFQEILLESFQQYSTINVNSVNRYLKIKFAFFTVFIGKTLTVNLMSSLDL